MVLLRRDIINIGMYASGNKKCNVMFLDFYFQITHKYRISPNNGPWHLFNVKALRGGNYKKAKLKKGRRLFQKEMVVHMKFETLSCSFSKQL